MGIRYAGCFPQVSLKLINRSDIFNLLGKSFHNVLGPAIGEASLLSN